MRAEMDVICVISNCPQLNNPCNAYNPTPVQVSDLGTDVCSKGSDRQSRRDRLPHHSHAEPDGHRVGRGLFGSGPAFAARRAGGRSGAASDRRPRRRAISISREFSSRAREPARRRSIPAMVFSAKMRISPKPARRAGSRSSARRPTQMRAFGLKHTRARDRGRRTAFRCCRAPDCLPICRGSANRSRCASDYPVMLKSTAGGGGIGMRLCRERSEVAEAFAAVERTEPAPASKTAASIWKNSWRARGTSKCRFSATAAGT